MVFSPGTDRCFSHPTQILTSSPVYLLAVLFITVCLPWVQIKMLNCVLNRFYTSSYLPRFHKWWYIFSNLYEYKTNCPLWGSNSQPSDFETDVLPTALRRLMFAKKDLKKNHLRNQYFYSFCKISHHLTPVNLDVESKRLAIKLCEVCHLLNWRSKAYSIKRRL